MSALLTTLKTSFSYRPGPVANPLTDTASSAGSNSAGPRAWLTPEKAAKLTFFAVTGLLVAYIAALVGADHVLAQADVGSEYQDDAVHRTLENVRNYIIGILLLLGAIGFALGLGVKAIAGTNENMHHASHLAMKGGILAVVGSAIVIPVMEIAQGIAEAGSSGGGGG